MTSVDTAAASSCNRDISNKSPGPLQDCRDVVHLTIFFDGTGNNREADTPTKSWSNVARMSVAALNQPQKSIYSRYVAGIGTKYNGKAANWLGSARAWAEDNAVLGQGFGAGGSRRLSQAEDEVNDRLRDALIENARRLGKETAEYAASASNKSFADVNEVVGKHRLIKMINISYLGFSRGAALARAFSNRVIRVCKKEEGSLRFEGYPIRFNFLGVFDTVASFGVPAKNVRLPFEERELIVSPLIERCVHYVAANEVRMAFPVDLIRKNGKLAGEWVERVYPGVHSDIGGGYNPAAQGIDNNYALIPLRDMMSESVASGVRIVPYAELQKTSAALFNERFKINDATLESYRKYLAACGSFAGTVEEQIKRHMQFFYSANGTMHRKGIESPNARQRKEDWYRNYGSKGMAWEISHYRDAAKKKAWVRLGTAMINGYAQYIEPADWQIAAWGRQAPDDIVHFISRYVHDSKVDFIANLEPFSYFRPRGIQESTANITLEWGYWMGNKVDQGKQVARDAYECGKKKVNEAADATVETANQAADEARRRAEAAAAAAQRKAEEAARYAQRKAQDAKAAADRAYDATAQAAQDAAQAAQRKAQEAAAYARRQAQAAANAVESGYDATTTAGKNAAAAAGRAANDVREGAEVIYDRGINWIRRTAKDVGDWF